MHIRYCITCFVCRPTATEPEFLLLKRGPLDDFPGTWQPLSGQIEHGESATRAALRHVREMLNVEPAELYALNRVRNSFLARLDALITSTVFVAVLESQGQIAPAPHGPEARWIKLGELDQELSFTVDREALAELRQDVLSDGPIKPLLQVPIH